MKQVNIQFPLRMLGLLFGLFLSVGAFAQIDVKGHVKDATGEPIIGATVRVDGTQTATVTDFDGNFVLKANQGADITVSYIGYQSVTVKAAPTLEVTLQDDAAVLNEVVVIGYGAVKKSDLTGSVTALKPDTKNKGLVVNPQDMMQGKIAGVSVTSSGGAPGGGASIRIRGGSSLNASNDPLIVIDGVPMDNNGVKGLSNPLAMVNPQDIESFNVLKDASATAIYGSRGSNGVIIITTKKGRKGAAPQVSYSGSVTMSHKKKTVDVLDGDQYRDLVKRLYTGHSREEEAFAALGDANTNWQDEIYRTAWSHDHNVTVAGSVGNVPYRVSLGFTDQQGILKTSDFKRYTAALNLNPSLLDDHLTLNLNAKGMWAKTQYANTGAIGAAVAFDPTKPVYDDNATNFGGYWEWQIPGSSLNDPAWETTTNRNATSNPVALLELNDDRAISRSFIGNADIDYKIHGFEDLRLHLTLGGDFSEGKQWLDVDRMSPAAIYYGNHGWDRIKKQNLTLSGYAQYYKDFAKIHHFDIMGGYEWQHFWREQKNSYWGAYPSTNLEKPGQYHDWSMYNFKTENYLVSFFGRLNYILAERYYLTATLRDDGSSRFKDHWSLFPSAALAWKISEEKPLKDLGWLSDLKLRLSYGKTGQQELPSNIGDYPYFAIYGMNTGVGSYYNVSADGTLARPEAYNPELKWETTDTYNVGLDFGFLNQRITIGIDAYYRKTTDLLNIADVAAGSNFKNSVISNIGSMENKGIEVTLGLKPIQTDDWYWTIDYNFTYNHNEITELVGDDPNYFVPTGGIGGGTGVNAQAHAVGHPMRSYYVYQQVYDANGKPIEGLVVDRNGDGTITEADKYFYKSPFAPVTMGLSSRLEYKSWDLGFTLRANIGNYVFNNLMSGNVNMSAGEIYSSGNNFFGNRPVDALDYNWQTYDLEAKLSDHWVQNGSFLKCDNITLGYSFADLLKCGNYKGISGRIYATASNVFCITKYKGIDPEVFEGIDNNLYPRPISFILGLNLNF